MDCTIAFAGDTADLHRSDGAITLPGLTSDDVMRGRRHDTELCAVGVDHADRPRTDLVVDAEFR